MKHLAWLAALLFISAAHAAPTPITPGRWAITAHITTPMDSTLHYTSCNKGKSWSGWIVKPSQSRVCENLPSAPNHIAVRCAESLPNGMKAVTSIHGPIHVSADGNRFHSELSGGTALPGGMQAPFKETLTGTYQGACK
jgi:hypothetical protein